VASTVQGVESYRCNPKPEEEGTCL